MKRLDVIVVDDQSDFAETTGQFLRLAGHRVSVFQSGRSVLDALDHGIPDLILSDLNMPEMDGCELAMRIKRHAGCEHIILAAISGFEDEAQRQASRDAGFDYQFVKPVRLGDLQNFVQAVAYQRGLA